MEPGAAAADSGRRDAWAIDEVVAYVTERGWRRVTLQFPDDMLDQAPAAARSLQEALAAVSDAKVYVMADTTYNPLSVDEVAAQHVNADCVVHYGHASLTPVTRTPALCVLPRGPPLDAADCASHVAAAIREHAAPSASSGGSGGGEACGSSGDDAAGGNSGSGWVLITYDQCHAWQLPQLRPAIEAAYSGPLALVFAEVAPRRLDPPAAASAATARTAGCGSGGCCATVPEPPASQQLHQQQKQQEAEGCCSSAAGGSCVSGSEAPAASVAEASCSNGGGGGGGGADTYTPPPLGGLVWQPPGSGGGSSGSGAEASSSGSSSCSGLALIVWLGPPSSAALTHLQLTHSGAPWARLDPAAGYALSAGLSEGLDRLLRRRYFLVEKARGASIVGLLVGTLGAAGYLEALEALRDLAAQAGKKTYTLLMGKPNPAKLANFPEVEVFVMVAEPQGLILDSKDFLSPIITPHEALLAFTDAPLELGSYRLDYGGLLAWAARRRQAPGGGGGGSDGEERGEGAAAAAGEEGGGGGGGGGGALVAAVGGLQLGSAGGGKGGVVARSAAEYLTKARSFQGLETPATGAEIKEAAAALPGRAGRAAGYVDEPKE